MQQKAHNPLEIYTDGASRGNPGKAAWAYLFCSGTTVIKEDAGYLKRATNNEAEYHAVINALKAALDEGYTEAVLYSDSELVIRQLEGVYQVRAEHLKPLFEMTRNLITAMKSFRCHAVPRDHPCISRADRLCNRVLDSEVKNKKKISGTETVT